MRLPLRLCLSASLLWQASPACSEGVQIQVEENKDLHSKHYLLRQDDCKILWRLQFFQSGSGFGIREEVDCQLSPAEQIPLRSALLQKVALDTNQMQGMRNFVWGEVPNRDIFMPRLAQALHANGKWDAGKGGWRASADVNAMRSLMNKKNIFSEVRASFAAQGWDLQVVDVEKIQVATGLLANNTGKYPINCSIVFSVKKQILPELPLNSAT